MWEKVKTGAKIAVAFLLALVAFLLGRKLWGFFHGGVVKEVGGKIENPNRKADQSEADRVRADREALSKNI